MITLTLKHCLIGICLITGCLYDGNPIRGSLINPIKGGTMARLYAYCGLDCSECPAYKATQSKDKKELEALLEEWDSPDYPLTVENLACDGCSADSKRVFKFCGECPIRQCAHPKGYATCADCPDFPCSLLEKHFEW